MSVRFSLPRPLLWGLAILFAAAAVLYSSLWMYYVRYPGPQVELGFNNLRNPQYDEKTHSLEVADVIAGSPAERMGLRAGDHIIGVNGRPLLGDIGMDEAYARGHPGDPVAFTVVRLGEPKPIILHGVFRARSETRAREGLARTSAMEITGSFPVLFLVVGFAVLFLRLDDPFAWLLALMFCGFIAAPSTMSPEAMHPAARAFSLTFRDVFYGLFFASFYTFFALFPARSFLERRLPWLKWVSLALALFLIPSGLSIGNPRWPEIVYRLIGATAGHFLGRFITYTFVALGMISLAGNGLSAASPPEVRRKSRVILWGTFVGFLPIILERMAVDFFGYQPSFWLDTVLVFALLLFPLSFAYAVVKDRVLEIPVLLRRSARYVLVQRGFIVLLFVAAAVAIALFTHFFSRVFPADSNLGMTVSAVFGIVLVWVSAPMVRRGIERIDRAFFRSAYDARMILHDLAEKARTVSDRHELASLLEAHIQGALHPTSFACYLEAGESRLVAQRGVSTVQLPNLSADLPVLRLLARRGKSWDVPLADSEAAAGTEVLAPLAPECLVPILGRDSRLLGLLVLGQRRSEEPYSDEDKRLLDSVANQAGIALENIRLAEKMAERMEAERRAAQELQIAREVQKKLLPQQAPPLATLDYAGECFQARAVGGDYYDFLALAPGRLGFVLADVAGKGISAALLMANLQANLRSQYATALEDPRRLLQGVNRLFYENTEDNRYATLFFACYDDSRRLLQYINCGHNPPLLLRRTGSLERLSATATVLGMFSEWECGLAEVEIAPGDLLVIYSDGVTEASDRDGNEFGETSLMASLRALRHLGAAELIRSIATSVQRFRSGEPQDDLTLVVARGR